MSEPIIYVGMDVHKDTVTLAVLPANAVGPRRPHRLANDPRRLKRFFDRLATEGTIRACYEAGPAGYVLQRQLTAWGYHCDVIAPSLTPQRPGQQRKHDKYDASELARYYRSGDLVIIRIPTETEERVRDLVRCRETFQRELLRSRHYVVKFLARRGLVYRDGGNWTQQHVAWLHRVAGSDTLAAEDVVVLREYLALLAYKLDRREELDRQIEALALTPAYRAAVGRLRCFRGIATQSAMVLHTEIGDWRRFRSPREVMAYVGLVPREDSSGPQERRGPITKAGNAHCRHILVQAAWAYRHQPRVGATLAVRQRGQPPAVVAHAWKAQHRLHKLSRHLAYRKGHQVAVVAVARELVGFLWAVMQEEDEARRAPAA